MNKIKDYLLKGNRLILILLAVHFLINIGIYLNTNTFYEISESGAIFNSYNSLIKGEHFLPISGYYFLTPAFIAYFINVLTGGGLFLYFMFHIILSTITVYLIYRTTIYITNSRKKAVISVILMMFYLEYDLLGSIFYNQLYEILFASAFLLLIMVFNDEKRTLNLIFFGLLLLIIIFTSMFFRKTLFFVSSLFIYLLIFNFKDNLNLLKYSVLAVLSILILYLYNPYRIFNSNYLDNTETLFWGHTLYGGLGGEGSFVFPENEKRYNERLKQYLNKNKIDTVTPEVTDRFRMLEVKTFITHNPHKWLFLQIKKVFYTFDSVPQKDGLLMLYKGKIKMPWYISALIIQFSYSVILIMFLITVDLNYKKILHDKYKRIIYFFGLYLIGGICIFSAYQERYRPVIFVCLFIPVIAMNFDKFKNILHKENRKELIIKLIIILILLTVWIYQAYEAMHIYHDRYFKVLE